MVVSNRTVFQKIAKVNGYSIKLHDSAQQQAAEELCGMIETLENIKNHPLFTNVDALKVLVGELEQLGDDSDLKARVLRLSGLLRILDANIKGSQDVFTPGYAIEEANQHIQNCAIQVGHYKSNQQITHYHAAIKDIENAIRVFVAPFRLRERKVLDEYIDKISQVSQKQTDKVAAFLIEAEARFSALSEELDGLGVGVGSQKTELDRVKGDISSALSNLNEEFQKRQVERSNTFSEQVQKFNERTTAVLEEKASEAAEITAQKEKEISDLIKGFSQKLDETLADSVNIREQIRKLAGLAGTEALVGRFHKVGKDQRTAAGWYRAIAYIGFLATAIYMAYTVYITQQGDFKGTLLETMIAKSQLALFLLIPSTFLAIELRRLNRSQARLQELELLISAFGPFVDDLPTDEKNKLKQSMAPIFFNSESTKPEKETTISEEQIKMFGELMKIGKA